MNNGFVKVAAATPKIKVGDCGYNGAQICKIIDEVYDNGAQLVVFPELCITGYTCSDLFWQKSMLDMAKTHLQFIAEHCEDKEIVAIVGLPMIYRSKLYNVAAVIYDGEILGLVPKTYIPNYSEFYEARHFTSGKNKDGYVMIGEEEYLLEQRFCLIVLILKTLVLQSKFARICGFLIHQVQAILLQEPQLLQTFQQVTKQQEKIFTELVW